MPSDARKLSDWLLRQPGALDETLSRSRQLARLNSAFRAWLGEPWAEAIRIAGFDHETAVFFATNAPASTLLRYRTPAILTWLQEHGFPACSKLQISVRPDTCREV